MKLIENLLNIEAIKINIDEPYIFSSGLESPIYCDNRKILSYPEIRNMVKVGLLRLFLENFNSFDFHLGKISHRHAGLGFRQFSRAHAAGFDL